MNKTKMGVIKIKCPTQINLFICGLILLPIYIKLMSLVALLFSFPTTVTTYIYYGILWILLITSIPEIIKHINLRVFLISLCVLFFLIFHVLIFPESKSYVFNISIYNILIFQPESFIAIILFTLIGLSVTDFDQLHSYLHMSARIGVVGVAVSYLIMIFRGGNLNYDDMNMAYCISLVLCILVSQWVKGDWIYLAGGTVCLILAGTRGPMFCLLMAIICKMFFTKTTAKKKIISVVLCLAAGFALYFGAMAWLLNWISNVFSRFGIYNLRILDYINSGMLLDSSGRDGFADIIISAIKNDPILGYGIGSDRLLLQGYYVHNIILEVFLSVGVFLGGLFLGTIGVLFAKSLKSTEIKREIVIGLFCGIAMKLLFSSTLLVFKEFFVFIGICIAIVTTKNTISKTQTE